MKKAKAKAERWYEKEEGVVYIYDAPYPSMAMSVSIVSEKDLKYYYRHFRLRKVEAPHPNQLRSDYDL